MSATCRASFSTSRAEVAPRLTDRWRVVLPDLPGHGGSTQAAAASSVSDFADRLADLLRRERACPAVVAGHSLGGLVALRLAALHPERVAGLLLTAAAGISSTRRRIRYALEMLAIVKPGTRLAAHRARIAASPRMRALAFGWWGASDPVALSPTAVHGFLAGWELHTDTVSAARALVLDDPRTDLADVRCPCVVLWGARDRQLGVADGFEYARRLGAPLRVIPDCGHLLIGERPDAVVDALESVLAAAGGGHLRTRGFAVRPSKATVRDAQI
jgi:pimeloyl-ACP methyl ester carboxylesterase